jgi:Uma2 family endonuclease
MDTPTIQIGMSLEEYNRLSAQEGPFEIVDGERIPKMPNVAGHGAVVQTIVLALHAYLSNHRLGEFVFEMPFVLSYISGWVTGSRIPDVMYFIAERIDAYKAANPDWKKKPYILVPDLVIEVISPTDNLSEVDEKIDRYLIDGVSAVWTLDPQQEKASLYTLISLQPFTKQQTTLKVGDTLTGGEIIPGFEIPVATLFE